jgi:hypothetical protein
MLPDREAAITYVRPPALYYLFRLSGPRVGAPGNPADREAFRHWIADPAAARLLIVDQALLHDNQTLGAEIDHAGDRLEEVGRVAYRPAAPVVLDDFFPGADASEIEAAITRTYQLVVYRKVRPSGSR